MKSLDRPQDAKGGNGGTAPNSAGRTDGVLVSDKVIDKYYPGEEQLKGGNGGLSGTNGQFQKSGTYSVSTATGASVTINTNYQADAPKETDPGIAILTYDANGGNFGADFPVTQTVYTEQTYPNALTDKKPTKTGYKFIGWHYDQTEATQGIGCAGNDWDAEGNGTYYYDTSHTTLYAVWEAKKSTLTLDNNHSDTDGWQSGSTAVYQKYESGWV